ncbi:MAG: DUF3592 domain-containing protein [Anaerolineae bacterium]
MEGLQGNRLPAIRTPSRSLWPFLLIGLSEVYKVVQLERSWVSTHGTVVDNMTVAFATGASYAPVVDSQTLEGETVRFIDGVGTIPPDYEIGAEVKVLYDPDDVHNAQIVSWKRLWLAPTILTCVGLVPMLSGVVVICVVGRKLSSSRRPAF